MPQFSLVEGLVDRVALDDLPSDICILEEEMRAYECRYGVPSESSCQSYINGKAPADDAWVRDWPDWTFAGQTWRLREQHGDVIHDD